MASAEVLQKLRLVIGSQENFNKEVWQASGLSMGIAKGIVAELSGNARVEWLIRFFKDHPDNYIFWCYSDLSAHPTALKQRGIDLNRILFIEVNNNLQKVLHRALESGQYPFIVAPTESSDIKSLQRLNILAGKAQSTVFLLAKDKLSSAWPISLQLDINDNGKNFDIDIVRQKYGGSV